MNTTAGPRRHIRAALSGQDAEAAATVVASSFAALDATAWLVPDASQRIAVLRNVFRIVIEHAQVHGRVDLLVQPSADDRSGSSSTVGAAVWLYHDHPIPPPPDYDERLQDAAGPFAERFRALDCLFENNHPVRKHHYLAMLAAVPDSQGTNVGSALLLHHHATLGAQNMHAYLVAANERGRDLYSRNGYCLQGEPLVLPNRATFYPMWRTPEDER